MVLFCDDTTRVAWSQYNISVIESEIVKLKAGSVWQQITAGVLGWGYDSIYVALYSSKTISNVEFLQVNGGSSSWKIDTSIFFTTTQNYLLSIQYRAVEERRAEQR